MEDAMAGLLGYGYALGAFERAERKREAAEALGRLAGHYDKGHKAKRSANPSDDRAFKNRVRRRRAAKGYR
jgi:hypothetical protein